MYTSQSLVMKIFNKVSKSIGETYSHTSHRSYKIPNTHKGDFLQVPLHFNYLTLKIKIHTCSLASRSLILSWAAFSLCSIYKKCNNQYKILLTHISKRSNLKSMTSSHEMTLWISNYSRRILKCKQLLKCEGEH